MEGLVPTDMSLVEIARLPLVVAVVSQVAAQAFKVILYSFSEKRIALDRFVNAAGIPSAHTAFVTALAATIGMKNGVTSDIFAVAFVFAAIVIYDSFRLRGHVQRHAEVLNQLLKPRIDVDPAPQRRRRRRGSDGASVSERVGHTLPEVAAGLIWGLMFAVGLG